MSLSGVVTSGKLAVESIYIDDIVDNPMGVPPGGQGGTLFVDAEHLCYLDKNGVVINLINAGGDIKVAKSGTKYTTIASALLDSSPGDTVTVYPGIYTENVVIPNGVRLQGAGSVLSTIIAGADTTSARVTMPDSSSLRNLTVVAPSSGSNPGIDASGLSSGELAIVFNVAIQGAGGDGAGVLGAGAGTLGITQGLYHVGGTLGGSFIDVTSGKCLIQEAVGIGGNACSLLKMGGASKVTAQTLATQSSDDYTLTDIICIGGTSQLALDGFVAPHDSPAVNALHIASDGVRIDLTSCQLHASTYDVLVDPGLTGAGTSLNFTGKYKEEKFSAPSGWRTTAKFNALHTDDGEHDESGAKVVGPFSVGTVAFPSETAMGEGNHTTADMKVFSYDGVSTYVDNSTAAASKDNSTFAVFQGVTSGNIVYIGNTNNMFPGIYSKTTIALVRGGGGGIWEYWNGSVWDEFNIMAAQFKAPHTQFAQTAFERDCGDNVRFDTEKIFVDWTTTLVNSVSAYWVRYRLTSDITTSPTTEQIRCITNHTRIAFNGNLEYFGCGQPYRNIPLSERWALDGSEAANHTFTLSNNVALDMKIAKFANSKRDGFGHTIIMANGLDTSRKLKVIVRWTVNGNDTGDVELELLTVQGFTVGADAESGSLPETSQKKVITIASASNNILQETTFDVDISDELPNNQIVFALQRDARGSNAEDTLSASIKVFEFTVNGVYWTG